VNVERIASLEGLDAKAALVDEMAAKMHRLQMVADFAGQPRAERAQRTAVVLRLWVFHHELLQVSQALKPI